MKKDFVSFYDNQVLPISFINNFISEYIEKNNLNKSLNKIKYVNNNEIGVGCSAGYDVNSKILLIDYEQIIQICLELYGMDSKNISIPIINLFILDTLYHELVHIKQFDVIYKRSSINEEVDKFLYKLYTYLCKDEAKEIYDNNHDIFLLEHNANLTAGILTDNFVTNAIFEEKGIKLSNIYELFYYYVNKSYGKNLIPLNEYNLLTNENIKPIEGLDTYNKIMYGMPINELEYEKVKKIEYAKVTHKYIKEYLNS